MSRILVVDSSVVVKWIIEEPDSYIADRVLQKYHDNEVEFAGPELLYAEIGNIVWKKVVFDGISLEEATQAFETLKTIEIDLTATSTLFDSAFSIATNLKRTFYDSLYLALQTSLDCDFVTADERLYNAIMTAFPKTILLTNWQE